MKKVRSLSWFLNEGLSLSEIKKITKTKEYKEVARALQDVREVSDIWNMLDPKMFEFTEDEFEDIFYDWWGDQGYDSLREFSTGGSTEDAISLYKHLLPYLVESVVTEKFSFSKKEVEMAASLIASAISKADRVKAEVHHLEYDKGRGAGFDISIDDEESAGGSYVVRDNGDVVNVAISNSQPNAVYSTIGNKDIADVFTNMKKYESVVTEAKFVKDFDKKVLKANTKEEVLKVYPNAKFFVGKLTHFFGELDKNLFFRAHYAGNKDGSFQIESVYSKKGSNYVHLYNEPVGESVDVNEKFHRMSKETVENELYAANQALTTYYDWLKAGNDSGEGKSLDHIIKLLQKCKKDIKKFNKAEEVEGTAYESVINEWGSSDQSTFNKSIHKDIGSPKKMPSPFDDKLRAAAEEAVDFYWDEWPEYQTNRDGLIDDAVRGYLRRYFKEDFQMMQKMFASKNNESVVTEAKSFSESEIKDAAEVVADAVAKVERTKAEVIEFKTLNKDGKIAGFYIQKATNTHGAPSRYWVTNSGEIVSAFRHDTFGNGVIAQVGDKLASVVKTFKANESAVTEAKFVKDFDKDVLDAETKADITTYYPSAKFFMGKMTHFFGELDKNLFFKAYYKDYVKKAGGKIEGDFKIVMIYSEKGSNYVPLFTREAGSK